MKKEPVILMAVFTALIFFISLTALFTISQSSDCHGFSDNELEAYGLTLIKNIAGDKIKASGSIASIKSLKPEVIIEFAKNDLGCESKVDFEEMNNIMNSVMNEKEEKDIVSFPAEIIILTALLAFSIFFLAKIKNIGKKDTKKI
ncbi:MAG TPA: hypothetical protein VI894_01595 [Candidatus Nanoarchaeia archaeon]|nr:hypothetical protein [Candidatus Nanoarchaeia archaeon]